MLSRVIFAPLCEAVFYLPLYVQLCYICPFMLSRVIFAPLYLTVLYLPLYI